MKAFRSWMRAARPSYVLTLIHDWATAGAARLGETIGGARMDEDLIDTIRETIKFLRKLTAELRRIADGADPGAVQQLRRTADQCEAEANDLSERFGIGP